MSGNILFNYYNQTMTYTPLLSTDNWSTSRWVINANFAALDVTDALKVEFSWTVPVDWDLAVFSGPTGKVIKKKVFTASQTLESDSNGQPTSAAKGTAYNKNFGTAAGTVLEGSNNALYVHLAWTETITWAKTFSIWPVIPTQAANDNSTKAASTAYVENAVTDVIYWVGTAIGSTYWTKQVPIIATSWTALAWWTLGTTNVVQYAGAHTTMVGSTGADFTATTPLPWNGSTDTYSPTLGKIIRMKARLRFPDTSDRKGWGMCITAANIHTAQTDITNGEIRFILNGSTMYAQNANGTTATSTDVSSGVTFTNWNTFEIIFNPWVSVLFYINGTLVATHTTNLPTTGTLIMAYWVNANGRQVYTFPPVISIQA